MIITVFYSYENPKKRESEVYSKNKHILEPYVIIPRFADKSSAGRPYIERYYSEIGIYLFIMKARTEKAEQIQIWMAKTLRDIRINRYKLANTPQNSLTREEIRQIVKEEVIAAMAPRYPAYHKTSSITKPISSYLAIEPRINREQRKVLGELVTEISNLRIQDQGEFKACIVETWGIFHNRFSIKSVGELPVARYEEARSFLLGIITRLVDERSRGSVS